MQVEKSGGSSDSPPSTHSGAWAVEGGRPCNGPEWELSIYMSPWQPGTGLQCPPVQIPTNIAEGEQQAWGTCTAQEAWKRCHPCARNLKESLGEKSDEDRKKAAGAVLLCN